MIVPDVPAGGWWMPMNVDGCTMHACMHAWKNDGWKMIHSRYADPADVFTDRVQTPFYRTKAMT